MHHKYIRYAQYVYSVMVPITIVAFMFAMMATGGFASRFEVNTVGAYDVVGLILVSFGVFVHNYSREKT